MQRYGLIWAGIAVALLGVGVYLLRANHGHQPLPSGSSRLSIYQTVVGQQLYTEGSRSYLTITANAGGSTTLDYAVTEPAHPVFSDRLAPGRYTIKSWQRPCDGNCDNLDDQTDRCQSAITLPGNQSSDFVVLLSPGRGCRILARVIRAS